MQKEHRYQSNIRWTGNKGQGTLNYKDYERSHIIEIAGKPDILASSDPAFRGDPTCHNPEDMLVASLSSCHMLWYLHLCSINGVVVTGYTDQAIGVMEEKPNGSGAFKTVTLNPIVVVAKEQMIDKAIALHKEANEKCFISNSCNFPVKHNPKCTVNPISHEI